MPLVHRKLLHQNGYIGSSYSPIVLAHSLMKPVQFVESELHLIQTWSNRPASIRNPKLRFFCYNFKICFMSLWHCHRNIFADKIWERTSMRKTEREKEGERGGTERDRKSACVRERGQREVDLWGSGLASHSGKCCTLNCFLFPPINLISPFQLLFLNLFLSFSLIQPYPTNLKTPDRSKLIFLYFFSDVGRYQRRIQIYLR